MANPNPNEENRFKPGVSGNPKGRPPQGYSITDTIREMMNEKPEIKRALGTKLIELALKGDMTALSKIWSYLDGMPVQTSNIHMSEDPEEKVKRTLELLKENVLPSGSSDVLQDQGGESVPSDKGSE